MTDSQKRSSAQKILLVDFDSKIPNLALMKISAHEKARGSVVGFDIVDPDLVICSVIFSKNRAQAEGLKTMFSCPVEFGGPGWDLTNRLLPQVELIKPDYDLYPSEYSQGFTTRGCIRKCGFCIVPNKEGSLHQVQHPSAFHDDRFNTCMLMDNNLFGAKKGWVKSVLAWFSDGGIKMLSPQGWDARLLTEEYAGILKDIRHPKGLHFAWDNRNDETTIINAIDLLKNAGFRFPQDISFYVLAGYDSTFEDALYRCNRLKELGVNSFVMPYHKRDPQINRLARWANRRWAYWSGPFQEAGMTQNEYSGKSVAEKPAELPRYPGCRHPLDPDRAVPEKWVQRYPALDGLCREIKKYTGRQEHVLIRYILRDFEGMAPGFVAMAIDRLPRDSP